MNFKKRFYILKKLKKIYLNKKFELNYNNLYELLISILLSSQTKDNTLNRVTKNLFLIANNPYDMLKLNIKEIKKYIYSIGIYNKKANYILKLSNIIINKYNGNIPNNFENLIKLPGIGRKSANVFLNIAFNKLNIAVDTHVFRLSNRINLAKAKNVYILEKKLSRLIPKEFKKNYSSLLRNHGKNICKSYKPKCKYCKILKYCEFKYKD